MDIKSKAREFAIKAHANQVRKSEPDKPMIIHPIAVAKILEEYGYDDNVVAAGYLHDIDEDTKYTIEDLEKIFGSDIANLVATASEPDKSLPWEDRKMHTINEIKDKSFRNKLIVCADKINNIESLTELLKVKGMSVFDCFNRGYESQLWYFENIYKSIVYNEDDQTEIFKRLKNAIENLHTEIEYQKELENQIFLEAKERFNELRKLHVLKYKLFELKENAKVNKPIFIEFSGTPRTGKTTMLHDILDFFSKGGFDIKIIPEFTTSDYYKKEFSPNNKHLKLFDLNVEIIKQIINTAKEELNSNSDIILFDRGIYDRLIWMQRALNLGFVDENQHGDFMNNYLKDAKDLIDVLILNYADVETVLSRDYNCHMALEKRRFLSGKNVESYNEAMYALLPAFMDGNNNVLYNDTNSEDINSTTIKVTDYIIKKAEKIYKSNKDN